MPKIVNTTKVIEALGGACFALPSAVATFLSLNTLMQRCPSGLLALHYHIMPFDRIRKGQHRLSNIVDEGWVIEGDAVDKACHAILGLASGNVIAGRTRRMICENHGVRTWVHDIFAEIARKHQDKVVAQQLRHM